ncbi:MAG: hypothetical protein ACXQTR_00940 [Candidatus Methanospirareceae archaeon]
MPSIPVYLDERTYWKVSQIANRENITIAKAVQLIVKAYFEVLEKQKEVGTWQENTESSTSRT